MNIELQYYFSTIKKGGIVNEARAWAMAWNSHIPPLLSVSFLLFCQVVVVGWLCVGLAHGFDTVVCSVMPTLMNNKGKVECWSNEYNLRALYPSYVNNNISRAHTVFTTILLIDDRIVVVVVVSWVLFDSSALCFYFGEKKSIQRNRNVKKNPYIYFAIFISTVKRSLKFTNFEWDCENVILRRRNWASSRCFFLLLLLSYSSTFF